MTQQPFHALTAQEWLAVTQCLNYSQCKVYFYVLTNNPMGDRALDLRVRELARILNLSKSAVADALQTLQKLGYLTLSTIQSGFRAVPTQISAIAQAYLNRQKSPGEQPKGPEDLAKEPEPQTEGCPPQRTSVHSTGQASTPSDALFINKYSTYSLQDLEPEKDTKKEKTRIQAEESKRSSHSTQDRSQSRENSSLVESRTPDREQSSAPQSEKFRPKPITPTGWIPDGPWKLPDGKLDLHFCDRIRLGGPLGWHPATTAGGCINAFQKRPQQLTHSLGAIRQRVSRTLPKHQTSARLQRST